MARNVGVQHYRGTLANLPTLLVGELGFTTDTNQLYIGSASGNVLINSSSSGGLTFITVEKNLGSLAKKSGTFDITGLSGLTPGKQVLVNQAVAPYTGKGTLSDEASMNLAVASGYVLNATTIRVYWDCGEQGNLKGNVKWNYAISG